MCSGGRDSGMCTTHMRVFSFGGGGGVLFLLRLSN